MMARKRNVPSTPPAEARRRRATAPSRKDEGTWWGRNWHTLVILTLIMFLALFVRAYYGYDLSVDNGYLLSGGSDSYQHLRVIDNIMSSGEHLVFDPLINYPSGMRNVRPPLYDWSVAVSGMVLDSVGMVQSDAVGLSLVMSTAIWGTLTVIPVYMIGRQAFGNRAGLIAAFLFAIMAGHIQRSVMSNADHDAMILFFGTWVFYFLLMSLSTIKGNRWVSNWKDRGSITKGIKAYLDQNQVSLIYSMLGGVSLAAVAMIWKGFDYMLVIVLVYFLFQLLVDRFRNSDSMGSWLSVSVLVFTAMLVMAPVYLGLDYWNPYYNVPLFLCIGMFMVGLIFVATRDYPWTLVLPVLAIIGLAVVALTAFLLPSLYGMIVTGFGYFTENKLYSTISEAQSPEFSNFVFAFGIISYWLALVGVGYALSKVPKNIAPAFLFVVVWSLVSIYMAAVQARYLFNASPAFAVMAGWMTALLIGWMKLTDLVKGISVARGGLWITVKRTVKLRHVGGAIVIVFLIVLPNVWVAIDAGIPSELKSDYDQEIYDTMPDFIRPADYSHGDLWYLGAFSYSMPMPNTYWPQAWDWFSGENVTDYDTLPIEDRAAFLSWWDYGFEAAELGEHPTVADNYQNAYQFAGSFITAQGEEEGISLFIVRALEYTGMDDPEVNALLQSHGVDVVKLRDIMDNSSDYISVVLNDPDVYGPYDSTLTAINAKYAAARVELSQLGLEGVTDLYHDMRTTTGVDIGFFAIDARLFPFSALGYNIFYAPAKLSDHVIDPYTNAPVDFYQIYAVDQYGNYHLVEDVTSDMVIVDYAIVYEDMFYDCLLYDTFMGFGPSDLGLTEQGIPGISGSLVNYQPMQAWNMTHFRMVYRTAYYNPFPSDLIADHPDAWRAVGIEEAIYLQEQINAGLIDGVVDATANALQSGVVFVQYYDGALISGQLTTDDGSPYEDVWVTVVDEYGIPHQVVQTGSDGRYEVIAPFGEVNVYYTYGNLDLRTELGEAQLGYDTYNISYGLAMREPIDENGDGYYDYMINTDRTLTSADMHGNVFIDADADDEFDNGEGPVANATVTLINETTGLRISTVTDDEGHYEFNGIPPCSGIVVVDIDGHDIEAGDFTLMPYSDITHDVGVVTAMIVGSLVDSDGGILSDMEVLLTDVANGRVSVATSDSSGMFDFVDLLPGDYSVELNRSDLSIGDQTFELGQGHVLERTFVVNDAMTISGTLWVGELRAESAKVGILSDDTTLWVTTDSLGRFTATVPEGDYTVYCLTVLAGERYVYLGTVEADSDNELQLTKAFKVEGTVTAGATLQRFTNVEMTSKASGAIMAFVTNEGGSFTAYLPADVYRLYCTNGHQVYWKDISVTVDRSIDVSLSYGVNVSGDVWYDAIADGNKDFNEGIEGAAVTITDINGRTKTVITDHRGYEVVLPQGGSYTLTASKGGFVTSSTYLNMVSSDTIEDIELAAEPRAVTGQVTLAGGMPGIIVQFDSQGGTAVTTSVTTGVDGRYTVLLQPGNYDVIVEQNVSPGDDLLRYQYSSSIAVAVDEDVDELDIEIVRRVLVEVTLTYDRVTDITFMGPETVTVSEAADFNIYLIEGEYHVHAVSDYLGRNYAFLETVTLDEFDNELVITTDLAERLKTSLTYDGSSFTHSGIEVLITASDGTQIAVTTNGLGEVTVFVPHGSYMITVDVHMIERTDLGQRFVTYIGGKATTVSSYTAINIALERYLDNSTMDMSLLDLNGLSVSGAVTLTATNETAVSTEVSIASGGTTLDLAPGDYSIYAVRTGGTESYLGNITVLPYVSASYDLQLEASVLFKGQTVYYDKARSATVQMNDGNIDHVFESDSAGNFAVYLPTGTYAVDYSAVGTENGISVTYFTSTEMELETSRVVSVEIPKIETRRITIEYDGDVPTIAPGGKAVYTVTIENLGNVPETGVLTSVVTTYDLTFSQDTVELGYGTANTAYVTVTVKTPEDVGVSHTAAYVSVRAVDDNSVADQVALNFDVTPIYEVSLSVNDGEPTDGQNYTYDVTIANDGNDGDTFRLSITNLDQLSALGWQVTILDEDWVTIDQMSLDSGKVGEIKVVFTPTGRDNPSPNAELVLMAASDGDTTKYASLSLLPNMVELDIEGGVSVTGDDLYLSDSSLPTITLIMAGIAVAMMTMVILMSISRGVFSRRKKQ